MIALRYVPLLAGLNLAWEIVQLPLYTIWSEGSRAQIVVAIVHCTLGDVFIGLATLAIALTLTHSRGPSEWQWGRIAAFLVLLGTGYTVFSEWLNTTLQRWSYSELMPVLALGGLRIGISPLVQWLVVPLAALHFLRRAGAASADRSPGP